MTAPQPDLIEAQVPPEQVRVGDLVRETGDDEVIGDPQLDPHGDTYVRVPMRSGGAALLRRDTLVTVRRPRPTVEPAPVDTDPLVELRAQVTEVRDLAVALADAGTVTSPVIRGALDKVRDRIKADPAPAPAPAPATAEPAPKGTKR